jgi:hypothetical protein
MTTDVKQAAVAISASTTSASATIPAQFTHNYIRVVNPTTALCYVVTGAGSATATAANPAVGAYSTEVFKKPTDHDTVAVLLSTGTGTISVNPVSAP